MRQYRLFLAACLLFPSLSLAQNCTLPAELTVYINCRVHEVVNSTVVQNQNKQAGSSSLADNSTNMTDRTAAPDLLSLALNLAGATSGPNDATVANVNLYSLAATLQQKDPLEPEFYNTPINQRLRRVSFTLGQDSAEGSSTSGGQRTSVYGVKVAVLDQRTDLSNHAFQKIAEDVTKSLGLAGLKIGVINDQIRKLLHDKNKTQPDESDRAAIDKLIKTADLIPLQSDLDKWQMQAEKGAQLSFSFQSKLRPIGADEYRLETIFDKGLTDRWSADTNASFEYCKFRLSGLDQRGGRISQQFEYHFGSASKPTVLTFAGDGSWMTKKNPTYKGQFKLTFTLLKGIEFPLSATYASRTDLINEKDISGHFGFTFDVAKLAQLFTGKSGGN